jgi:hypothetical protein
MPSSWIRIWYAETACLKSHSESLLDCAVAVVAVIVVIVVAVGGGGGGGGCGGGDEDDNDNKPNVAAK